MSRVNYARNLGVYFVDFVHLICVYKYVILKVEVIQVPIKYKIDVLTELKKAGYSTYKLRQEKIFGERTIQKFRNGEIVTADNLAIICKLLNCQPGDIIEYAEEQE